jgi:hypothetical protein
MKELTLPEREALRESFRPKRIRLLFIGEAPPASGRFFYSCNSGLYRAMTEAFKTVNPRINDENFLRVFQASGCYMVDLCSKPIDQLAASALFERTEAVVVLPGLASRCSTACSGVEPALRGRRLDHAEARIATCSRIRQIRDV